MKKTLLLSLGLLALSGGAFAAIVPVHIGTAIDDEDIPRTLITFSDYEDTAKIEITCDVESGEVAAYLLLKNQAVPACWMPARGDGVGFFKYEHSNNSKEFNFDQTRIKFKKAKFNTVTKKIVK